MKTPIAFRIQPHMVDAGRAVVEVWYGDAFVASVTAAESGEDVLEIRVISKYLRASRPHKAPPPKGGGSALPPAVRVELRKPVPR